MVLNDCIQLVYHQSCRHHLILVYTREILILDLEINQTVGIIPLERAGSPFVQVREMYHWLAEGIGRRGKGIIPLERAGSPFVQVRGDGEEEIISLKRGGSLIVQMRGNGEEEIIYLERVVSPFEQVRRM